MPPLLSHSLTDKGRVRPNNEDCFLSCPEHGLWLVADGMGGHEAGEVASAITRDTIKTEHIQGSTLEQAILAAHNEVMNAIENGLGAQGMGSTVVAVQSCDNNYEIAWVGDSRAYLWTETEDGGQLEQLSTDHSYVQALLASGSIEPQDVENHPDKNIITQCIGSFDNPSIRVDQISGQWHANQQLILCSDGLTDELSNQDIAQVLCDSESSIEAAEHLMGAALNAGGKDNITVQVISSPVTGSVDKASLRIPATGSRWLDALLYALTGLALAALVYWLW